MKKIKLFILLTIIILTCTGCSVEYNINITEDNIEESINISDNITSTRTKEDILEEYNTWYPTYVNYITEGETIEIEDFSYKTEGVEYHQKKIENLNNGYKYTYNYTYPIDKYYDAYTLARTYNEVTVQKRYDSLVVKTSKANYLCDYDYFDEVKVNITVDPKVYKLNYTNTSDVIGNTYTWTLNRSNCNDSQILLTLDTISGIKNDQDNNLDIKPWSEYTLYMFLGILVLIIIVVYFIFKKMKEKNEKMDLDD